MLLFKQKIINNAQLLIYKDFTENFDKGYEDFKINELKDFDISEYLDTKEIRDEYLAQVLKDGDKDEISEAFENIEKSKK